MTSVPVCPTLGNNRNSPSMYVGTTYDIPNTFYTIGQSTIHVGVQPDFSDFYCILKVYKNSVLIGEDTYVGGGDSYSYDNGNICIGLDVFDFQATPYIIYDLNYNLDICYGVTCQDKCFGTDLWSMKCDSLTGICVQDIVKVPNSPLCSGSHYIEYDWSFLPIDFLNLVASGIVDISNVLGTDLPMPSNIVYKGATFSSGKFRVYVQYTPPPSSSSPVKLSVAQLANMTPQALTELLQAGTVLDLDFQPTSGLQTMLILPPMDIGIFAGTIAVVIIFVAEASIISKMPGLQINPWAWGVAAAIALIGGIAGTVLGYNIVKIFDGTTTGTGTVDKPAADKTKDAITTLETELAKCLAAYPCVTAIPPTPPCSVEDTNKYDTCAMAAVLINKINTDAIAGTPSSITQADVQAILDAYSDRQTALENGLITVQEALAQIAAGIAKAKQEAADKLAAETCGSGQIYDPSVMKCVQTADCWIAGFIPGTCMLTAKTGKTIAIIGGVVIGVYLVFSLIKK